MKIKPSTMIRFKPTKRAWQWWQLHQATCGGPPPRMEDGYMVMEFKVFVWRYGYAYQQPGLGFIDGDIEIVQAVKAPTKKKAQRLEVAEQERAA
jgi:hypothetical protein